MPPRAALLIIDAQVNMFDPASPVPSADALLERLSDLIARARAARRPVVFIRNCGGPGDPDQPGTPGWHLHPRLQPVVGELVLDKTTCDSFGSTPLAEELRTRSAATVVIAGLQSEYCVRATALGALERGLAVTLVSDGHSTYDGSGRTALEISAGVNTELAGRATLVRAADCQFE